jgi:hypothetical protein
VRRKIRELDAQRQGSFPPLDALERATEAQS